MFQFDLSQKYFLGLLIFFLSFNDLIASIPSSSIKYFESNQVRQQRSVQANSIKFDSVITFSEFPNGTSITNQYSDKGIIFGGDSPFITGDGANPTSPVLSGSPIFEGAIEGIFVDPNDGKTPTIVSGFSMDAGYFDSVGSVRLSWFAPDGSKLGQRIGSINGIQTLTVEGGQIASWRIETIKDEPAGFGIDNFSIKPLGASLIFREQSDGAGIWERFGNYIPGFDHVGMHLNNVVYESNVLHDTGIYVNKDGTEEAVNSGSPPESDDGVQYYHNKT